MWQSPDRSLQPCSPFQQARHVRLPRREVAGRHGVVVVKSFLWPRCSNSLCVRKKLSTDLPRDTMLQTVGPMSFVSQAICIDGN